MLARTKWHLFAGSGKQGGSAKAMQPESVSHVLARFIDSQWNIRPVNQPHVNTLIYQVLDGFRARFSRTCQLWTYNNLIWRERRNYCPMTTNDNVPPSEASSRRAFAVRRAESTF